MEFTKIPSDVLQKMKEAFKKYDVNNNGSIDHLELQEAFAFLGNSASLDEIMKILEAVDLNNDGQICFKEFTMMIINQLSKKPAEQHQSDYVASFILLGGNENLTGVVQKSSILEVIDRFGLTIELSKYDDVLTYENFEELLFHDQ